MNEEPPTKCPTCDDAKPFCCCTCGRELSGDELELSPNPFADEIRNDSRLHLECKSCRHESAMDI